MADSVFACNHLRVDVGLKTVDIRDFFAERGGDLFVVLPGVLRPSHHGFRDGYPRVVVAEDSSVFLVAGRVAGNLTQLDPVLGVSRVEQDGAVGGVEAFPNGVKSLHRTSVLEPDSAHHAVALRLNPDLPLFVRGRSDRVTVIVVGAAEPFAVPAVVLRCLNNFLDIGFGPRRLVLVPH